METGQEKRGQFLARIVSIVSPLSQPSAVKKELRNSSKAELFFFVVAGEEDLAVLVEVVNQTFDGVGRGHSHG